MFSLAYAISFAQEAHESIDQRRKYTNEPYFEHPKRVAQLVAQIGGGAQMIAAAYLHDVVEDVPLANLLAIAELARPRFSVTYDLPGDVTERTKKLILLEELFDHSVSKLVGEVTDISTPADGNRAARKQLDCAHLARASARGQTIKLADIIDNTQDICRHDPKFARTYLREKQDVLKVLSKGNADLRAQAHGLIEAGLAAQEAEENAMATFITNVVNGKCYCVGGFICTKHLLFNEHLNAPPKAVNPDEPYMIVVSGQQLDHLDAALKDFAMRGHTYVDALRGDLIAQRKQIDEATAPWLSTINTRPGRNLPV